MKTRGSQCVVNPQLSYIVHFLTCKCTMLAELHSSMPIVTYTNVSNFIFLNMFIQQVCIKLIQIFTVTIFILLQKLYTFHQSILNVSKNVSWFSQKILKQFHNVTIFSSVFRHSANHAIAWVYRAPSGT